MAAAQPAVEVVGLSRVFVTGTGFRKRDEEILALDGVSLTIAPREIHGLLGPNGAGKTTLVKILSTVLLPTSGTASVLGFDVVAEAQAVRRRIAIVFGGERGLYHRLTARQNLRYWGSMHRLSDGTIDDRIPDVLGRVGLTDWADRRVETFSRGMKQRLHLARGLISEPEVMFLDEPTVGMDPVAAREFRTLVTELRDDGVTILITTHDMAEAESLCDRVTLIDHGRILATEPPRVLARWITQFERIDVDGLSPELIDTLAAIDGVASVVATPTGHRVETTTEKAAAQVLERLVAAGVSKISTSEPSLEEVYLHVFGGRGLEV